MQHSAVKASCLERIMATFGCERAADERDPGQPVKEAEFAYRVGEIYLGFAGHRLATGTTRNMQSTHRQHCSYSIAARRVARNDDGQQFGVIRRNTPVG